MKKFEFIPDEPKKKNPDQTRPEEKNRVREKGP